MKTRFITDISHELRTPVTTIQLYAHLLQQFPARINLYLEKIIREADLQAQLVQDIQEISHFDAGRVEIHPKQTPLNALLAAIVEKHARLAQERGLTLTYHQTELAPAALVETLSGLEQVLDNMLLNAIHYTPRGGAIQVDPSAFRRMPTGIGPPSSSPIPASASPPTSCPTSLSGSIEERHPNCCIPAPDWVYPSSRKSSSCMAVTSPSKARRPPLPPNIRAPPSLSGCRLPRNRRTLVFLSAN
jgi:hypothetical protein